MRISYDPKCEELARWFLQAEKGQHTTKEEEAQVAALAERIQQAVEDWYREEDIEEAGRAAADQGEDESGQGEEK